MLAYDEADIALFPATAMFIPVITAMGGNVGIQSSAIVVKGLASNILTSKNILQSISKEISCAVINACICSSIIFILSLCFNLTSLAMPITVTISLFIVIMFASMFGTAFPLLLNKLNIDPALATGPFITLTNDIIGLNIYLFTGKAILGCLM
ncbi:MAG: magnesium transporter, partial [Butyricimonas faecihominis]